jgi:hypothetical protein
LACPDAGAPVVSSDGGARLALSGGTHVAVRPASPRISVLLRAGASTVALSGAFVLACAPGAVARPISVSS